MQVVGNEEGNIASRPTRGFGTNMLQGRFLVKTEFCKILMPSVLWCCWLHGRKGIWPVKLCSAIGPASFIVTASDLQPAHVGNALVKFVVIIPAVNSRY